MVMEEPRHVAALGAFIFLLALMDWWPVGAGFAASREEPTQGASPSPRSAWVPPFEPAMEQCGWRLGTFQSKTARAPVGYYYHLPPNYELDKDRRYPVVYWLHGLGVGPDGANPVVSRLDVAIKAGAAPAMILVSCTDPTKRSWWTDSKDGRIPVETVIVQDLIPHIDATFRTLATREGRAIEGHSMGGYGVAYLGFKYPDTFGTVSILAGALRSPETIITKGGPTFRTVFGADARYVWACSPWVLVQRNADRIRGRTSIRICVGEKDGLKNHSTGFHELLAKLGIDHSWSIAPNTTHSPEELFANWPGNPFEFYATAFAASSLSTAKP